ncbi:MAG: hypothetical protein V3T86_13370 [Planctomycetota bacterium]
MKYVVAFLLAVAVGAVAVSGEERSGEDAELRQMIEKVRARLRKLAEERAAAPRLEHRWHEVHDLTQRDQDEWLPALDLRPSSGRSYRKDVEDDGEPAAEFGIDQLVELIQTTVRPQSWETVEGSAIGIMNGALFVTAGPDVQRDVAKLLELLRRRRAPMLAIEIVAVPMKDGDSVTLSDTRRVLPRDQAAELLARPALGVARTISRSGFAKVHRQGRLISYVRDYDVEIAEDATIGQPRIGQVFAGFAVQAGACVDPGADGAVLHLQIHMSDVEEPIPTLPTEHGDVELPEMDLTLLNTSLWLPLNKTVLAGAITAGENPCLFLVTVRHQPRSK